MKLEGKHSIQHNLHEHYKTIKAFKKKKTFINSDFYALHQTKIDAVIDGLEWDNTLSTNHPSKDNIRIVSWNVERGKQLDGIIAYLKQDLEMSQADVILAIETDNGMGRTSNRNIAKELAEALGMNYCFAPSYLVLGKGTEGETNHNIDNTLNYSNTQ